MSGIETVEIKVRAGDCQDRQWKRLAVSGERVGEYLAVTPQTSRRDDGASEFSGTWQVTHLPTGAVVPRTTTDDVYQARRLATALAAMDVDWSSDDPARYRQRDVARRILTAIDSVINP